MPCSFRVLWILLFCVAGSAAAPSLRPVVGTSTLPKVLNPDFQFRKTKLYLLSEKPTVKETGKGRNTVTKLRRSSGQDASIAFERQYRLFGAVTAFDQRQRFGNYFDFFWRAKHPADVTVRLEYRQEKLRAFVQAREISYRHAEGTSHTEFAIVGDDYFDDGAVIAWRCLLIEGGRIVAENRSYLWE